MSRATHLKIRWPLFACVVSLLAAAEPAAARMTTLKTYCQVLDGTAVYASTPFEATVSTDDDYRPRNGALSAQFQAVVAKRYPLKAPMAGCSDYDVLLSSGQPDVNMLERFDRDLGRLTSRPGALIVPFKPGEDEAESASAPAPSPRVSPAGPATGPSLVVKTDTSGRDAAQAWDAQVKKQLAAEAQKKVDAAAKAIQADAKKQAEIAAFFAERRRQGRAQ